MTEQQTIDGWHPCRAPCWPIVCEDCPFGGLDTTLEQVQEWIENERSCIAR